MQTQSIRKGLLGAAIAAGLLLSGCSTPPTNGQIGTVAGAVVGGVAGHALIGGPLATVGGAAAGALLGHEVGRSTGRRR